MKPGDLIQFIQNGEVMICLKLIGGHSCHPYTQVTALAEGGIIVKSSVCSFKVIDTHIVEKK